MTKILVVAEHNNSEILSATLATVKAAQQIGGVADLAGQFGSMAAGKSSMDNLPLEKFENGGNMGN